MNCRRRAMVSTVCHRLHTRHFLFLWQGKWLISETALSIKMPIFGHTLATMAQHRNLPALPDKRPSKPFFTALFVTPSRIFVSRCLLLLHSSQRSPTRWRHGRLPFYRNRLYGTRLWRPLIFFTYRILEIINKLSLGCSHLI